MATQNYYTKDQAQLLNLDYGKIHDFAEHGNSNDYKVKVLYEGLVWDCDKKEFVSPKDLGCKGVQISKYGKFIECYWIELDYTPFDFLRQMHEDLNNLQRELDKEMGK